MKSSLYPSPFTEIADSSVFPLFFTCQWPVFLPALPHRVFARVCVAATVSSRGNVRWAAGGGGVGTAMESHSVPLLVSWVTPWASPESSWLVLRILPTICRVCP